MKIKYILKYTFLLSFLCWISLSYAQRNSINTYNVLTINTTYGVHFSGGDLSNRFGNNFSLGGGLDFITEKKNLISREKSN